MCGTPTTETSMHLPTCCPHQCIWQMPWCMTYFCYRVINACVTSCMMGCVIHHHHSLITHIQIQENDPLFLVEKEPWFVFTVRLFVSQKSPELQECSGPSAPAQHVMDNLFFFFFEVGNMIWSLRLWPLSKALARCLCIHVSRSSSILLERVKRTAFVFQALLHTRPLDL